MGTMTDNMTAREWADRYDVTFDWSATGYQLDDSGWEHHAYRVTLHHGVKSATFDWRQGLAIDDAPTAEAVLPALRTDAESGDMAWVEFCDNYGADPDSLRDYRTWEACKEQRRKLYDFMSSEAMWEDFLSIESD